MSLESYQLLLVKSVKNPTCLLVHCPLLVGISLLHSHDWKEISLEKSLGMYVPWNPLKHHDFFGLIGATKDSPIHLIKTIWITCFFSNLVSYSPNKPGRTPCNDQLPIVFLMVQLYPPSRARCNRLDHECAAHHGGAALRAAGGRQKYRGALELGWAGNKQTTNEANMGMGQDYNRCYLYVDIGNAR